MKTCQNVYRVGIFWICFTAFSIIFSSYIPIEFTNRSYAVKYNILLYTTLPIGILLTAFKPRKGDNYKTIAFTALLSVLLFVVLTFFAFWGGMCDWGKSTILLINIRHPSLTIVERIYGCGAYDSDMPKAKMFKKIPMTPYFAIFMETDTLFLDKSKWLKVE